jgi:hypothetical protein
MQPIIDNGMAQTVLLGFSLKKQSRGGQEGTGHRNFRTLAYMSNNSS